MNAALRKVLREVRPGLLITETNVREGRINRGRCPEMKRVPGWSRLALLWCHEQTNRIEREIEREREREEEEEEYQT